MRKIICFGLFFAGLLGVCRAKTGDGADGGRVIVAYVTSWSSVVPEVAYVTHINYAFGHVTESFDGIRIDNTERLRMLVGLKEQAPTLKVMLSVGGWGSGRFSEMAADERNRKKFAADCGRVVEEFQLDGVDIDWEYPTSTAAEISASPEDTENFTLLMRDIRAAIGKTKLLTLASAASAEYIDFVAIDPYIDFVNIMAYDMVTAPRHHSALFASENSGAMTSSEAVKKHLAAGIPKQKLVLGMPFYGRGGKGGIPSFIDYKKIETLAGYTERWDEKAQVPYLTDATGVFSCGFENPRSLAIKCDYIRQQGLLGGMYWDYDGDNAAGDLRKTVYEGLVKQKNPFKVLVLTERGGQHGGFTDAGMAWLEAQKEVLGMELTEINHTKPINDAFLAQFQVIIQLDYVPYTWSEEAEKAFERYIDEGRGGWIGFHHATLLGEFDGYPLWNWFSDFMGGIRFKNYIAPLADGTVQVEEPAHPVMKGVPGSFVVPDDEWYTFDKSPRPHVQVLASVDESTYRPASDIKMGDHPVVWVNPHKKARNVYFLMGHSKKLFDTKAFTDMFTNAIRWTSEKDGGNDPAKASPTISDRSDASEKGGGNAGASGTAQQEPQGYPANYASAPRFKALVYYTHHAEKAHVDFALQAVEFFKRLNYGEGFVLQTTTDLSDYPYEKLATYDIVVMLNGYPMNEPERAAFEKYMENGGGWMGFHAAAYNDKHTNWPWFVQFLGGGVFYCNNWPPQPVLLESDNVMHPVTRNLPASFVAPESEWYQWIPSPRNNPDVEVLVSLSSKNYPLGIKDVVNFGDFPIVWTNKKYRMIYLNMGHGDDEFTDATQKLLFINAFRWTLSQNKKGDPFQK